MHRCCARKRRAWSMRLTSCGTRSWTSLARRTENNAPFPYMIYFLAQGGVVLQVQLPLCIRDQDLDGRLVQIPRRSFTSPDGRPFEQTRPWELRLASSGLNADGAKTRPTARPDAPDKKESREVAENGETARALSRRPGLVVFDCGKGSVRRRRSIVAGEADQRDVVELRAIGDVALNRLHDFFAGGRGARPGAQERVAQHGFAQALAVGIHRVGDAVGVEDDGFSRLEDGLGAFVGVVGHDPQRQPGGGPAEFLQPAVAAADQRARMAGVDDAEPVRFRRRERPG